MKSVLKQGSVVVLKAKLNWYPLTSVPGAGVTLTSLFARFVITVTDDGAAGGGEKGGGGVGDGEGGSGEGGGLGEGGGAG